MPAAALWSGTRLSLVPVPRFPKTRCGRDSGGGGADRESAQRPVGRSGADSEKRPHRRDPSSVVPVLLVFLVVPHAPGLAPDGLAPEALLALKRLGLDDRAWRRRGGWPGRRRRRCGGGLDRHVIGETGRFDEFFGEFTAFEVYPANGSFGPVEVVTRDGQAIAPVGWGDAFDEDFSGCSSRGRSRVVHW